MVTYHSLSTIRPYQIWGGAVARAINGERLTMAVIDLNPNVDIPEHHHENEQLGFVMQGRMTLRVAGEDKELSEGEAYAIASNVPHSAHAGPDGATVVDVFAPVRADWEKVERLQPSPGRWPR